VPASHVLYNNDQSEDDEDEVMYDGDSEVYELLDENHGWRD
jgi:hypothetical protein